NGALSKLLANLANADAGLLWSAVVDKSKATILPPGPSVELGGQVTLSVVLSPDLTSTYEFDWSNSSPDATFSATGGTSGPSIMTEQSSVLLTYSGTAFDPIPVSLLVYDVANGQHAFVTKTATTVLVLATATIAPFNPFLASGDQQTFTVTVDDKLPASVQYLWSLTGRAGSIGAGGLVTTTPPSVQYTAIQQGIDTLSVQVLDALNNNLIAKTSTQVNVDQDPMKFTATIAGPWNPNPFIIQEPPDGTYSYTGGVGGRFAVDPGLDAVFFRYDIVGDAEGVTCILVVATGAALRAGETFATTVSGQPPTPGQFRVTLDPDQVNPTNTVYGPDATSGTLTIDSLVQTVDGVFVAHYSFRVQNNAGGTIMGSGVGRWT
ncbi:MAG: hypothetical protein ACRELE_02280, partial [Gemmatimonadales bacterium]